MRLWGCEYGGQSAVGTWSYHTIKQLVDQQILSTHSWPSLRRVIYTDLLSQTEKQLEDQDLDIYIRKKWFNKTFYFFNTKNVFTVNLLTQLLKETLHITRSFLSSVCVPAAAVLSIIKKYNLEPNVLSNCNQYLNGSLSPEFLKSCFYSSSDLCRFSWCVWRVPFWF